MNLCPVCSIQLNRTLLDSNLPAFYCSQCECIWVSANEYLSWLTPNSSIPIENIDLTRNFDTPFPISDNNKALICPDCGRIMRRFKIWPNHDFYLDRCSNCNGIWFDKNEWQTLQTQNFHNQLNIFFTHAWQENLRSKEMHQRFDSMYLDVFGAEDYQKIKDIRLWLADNPNGNRLLAYLSDKEPYKG